jgi:tetratricopeptide (TPR) repeat protein
VGKPIDFNTAIGLDPSEPRAYYERGLAYYERGEMGRALSDFTKVIELSPDLWGHAYSMRANVHRKTGDADLAIADLRKALEFAPSYEAYILDKLSLKELGVKL